MSGREILTLQFGHYANYVGAHFWNIQELSFNYTDASKTECNHDILYREGQTAKGDVTYTPRLLLADLKGALKSLPLSGGLPDEVEQNEDLPWEQIEKIEEPPPQKNEYLKDIESNDPDSIAAKNYNLDECVQTWSDYIYPRFHPRTVNIINEYQHGNENEGFDLFTSGKMLWKSEFGEMFSDKIRKYVEECDSMQGFQVNFNYNDGFAGLAVACIEHLTDEYSKTILAYPIVPSHFSDNEANTPEERDKATLKDSIRLANIALSTEEISQNVNMFVPLCTGEKGWRKPGNARTFDYIKYKPELYYHSSALLASAIDTLSFQYRHKENIYNLSNLCADMTGYGWKMVAASVGIPLAINESKYVIEHLNEVTKPLYTPITPSCKLGTDKLFQLITVRGIPENFLKAPMKEAKEQKDLPAYQCANLKEMFTLYFQSSNFLSATNVTILNSPLQTKNPFPKFFSDQLNKYGFVKNSDVSEAVESVPVIAGYHNGVFLSDMLEKMHREVGRIKFSKLHKFKEEGLEEIEFKETLERLSEFKDNYEEDFEL